MEITMQNFSSITAVKKWFNNRYLDSEVAYIKSKDHMVLLSTKSASTELNISSGIRLLISDDIITLEQKLLKYKKYLKLICRQALSQKSYISLLRLIPNP